MGIRSCEADHGGVEHNRRTSLAGRQAELTRLTSAIAAAAASGDKGGGPELVSISGEAGIGKTRLAEQAAAAARALGFAVLTGAAYPLGTAVAYGPLLEALGNYLRSLPPLERMRSTSGLEDLGHLFPDLVAGRPEPIGDPELEKARLFDAVARVLARTSERRPVLLLFDDLQWADVATLEMIQHLARPATGRMLILLVHRQENVPPSLHTLLVSLRRQGLDEIEPAGLSDTDVRDMLADLLQAAPAPELVQAVAARARGNPLFVQAQANLLLEAGALTRSGTSLSVDQATLSQIPAVVRDLVLGRIAGLSAEDRRIVDLLAVGADPVPHRLVTALDPAGEASLAHLQSMRLVHEVVLEEIGGGRVAYLLAHPLIQEVAYAELPELTRRRLHAAYARALENDDWAELGADLDRLARHLRLARDQADSRRLAEVLRAAGERAMALQAARAATEHLGAAVAAIKANGRTELLVPTLELLGDAWEWVGDAGAAVECWDEALMSRLAAGEAAPAARLHAKLFHAEWSRGRIGKAREHVREGLAVVGGLPVSPEHAEVQDARVQLAARTGDAAEAAAAAADLATVARRLDAPRLLARAAIARYLAVELSNIPATSLAAAEAAIAPATEAADPILLFRAHDSAALAAVTLGDHRSGHGHAAACMKLADELRSPPLQVRARASMSMAHLHAGDWALAQRVAEGGLVARQRPERTAAIERAPLALLAALRGEPGEARRHLSEAVAVFPALERDFHARQVVSASDVHASLAEGNVARVLEGDLLRLYDATGFLHVGVGEAAWVAGRLDVALDAAGVLHRRAAGTRTLPEAWARWLEGLVAAGSGDRESGLAHLASAAEIAKELEHPYALARARAAWGELHGAEAGAAALLEALEVFERLGVRRHADRARSVLRARGLPTPGRRRRPGSGPLTEREREVAVLAAQGLTTAELAARLYISPQTAATHLKRIYARLGVGSRAALVRYALEAGWLEKYPGPGTDAVASGPHRPGS